jgi:multiple antibiotic resistance protein
MTSFINIFFLTFAALFPIVNPLSNVPIFMQLTQAVPAAVRNRMSRDIALSGLLLLLVSLFLGSHLLVFFGITLPAVRIGGGAVITIMGWRLLNQGDNPIEEQASGAEQGGADHVFYPLTLPLTVGPGSIATAIALGSQWTLLRGDWTLFTLQASAAVAGLVAISVTVFLCYRFAENISKILGQTGTKVFMKLSSFILLCIGVQIGLDGILSVVK